MMPSAIFETTMGSASAAMLNGLIKGALVIAIVLLLDVMLRQYSAALRHRVWTVAFAALLVLPIAGYLVPAWHVPLINAPTAIPAQGLLSDPSEPATSTKAGSGTARAESSPGIATLNDRSSIKATPAPGLRTWGVGLAAVWVAGAMFLLLRLGFAVLSAGRTAHRAAELTDEHWHRLAENASHTLGLEKPVRIACSAEVDMPMAWGLRRHTVLLPAKAGDWSLERREVVLMHELAHVQRGDCAAQLVSSVAAALHWFNPLVWIARRRQAAERELACDDAVLSSGAAGADYAWHLLEIARASGRAQSFSPAGVTMARKSQLEGRLLAVLDPSRDRRQVSRPWSFGVVLATLLLVLPLAGVRPWAAPEAEAAELPGATALSELEASALSSPPVSAPEAPAATGSIPSAQDQATRERVVATMIDLLADDDPSMRHQAAHSLGTMEDASAVAALSQVVVTDSSENVRSQAAWALGMIESADGAAALSQALIGDASEKVRRQAAWALGMIEDPMGVSALNAALSSDDDAKVRSQAAWALGMIESSDAVAGLAAALRGDTEVKVRRQAAWALGMIEDEAAVEPLIDAVEDDDEGVRKQALWAISQIMG